MKKPNNHKNASEKIYEQAERIGMRAWHDLGTDLFNGNYPRKSEIAERLRTPAPVPAPIREFLAKYLEDDKFSWPVGPQRNEIKSKPFFKWGVAATYVSALEKHRAMPRSARGKSTPTELARIDIKDYLALHYNYHVSTSTVKKLIEGDCANFVSFFQEKDKIEDVTDCEEYGDKPEDRVEV